MTDSGGVVEGATSLRIRKRVLVLMRSTERTKTIKAGFAKVVGTEKRNILTKFEEALNNKKELSRSSPYGSGHAAEKKLRYYVRR